MNSRILLGTTAIILILVAVSWIIIPDILYKNFNITLSDDLRYMAWRYAAYIIGLAVTAWMARSMANTAARRAVLMGGFITIAITGLLSAYAALTMSAMAWPIAVTEILLAAWFVYILFVKPEAKAD